MTELKAFLKRPRYFFGQLLSVADLAAEQQYVISRQRLHNRNVHGHGVVCGLQVSTSSGSSSAAVLRVAPGHAIDCQGNDIAVLTEAVADPLPEQGEVIYLCLEWAERETEFSSVETDEPQRKQATRIEEYALLKYETTSPCARHKEKCKDGESCGEQHGVTLARLTKNRGVWKIDQRFKLCRARA